VNQKHIIALIFALGFAFFTAVVTHILFNRAFSHKEAMKHPQEATTAQVLVTTKYLSIGTPVTTDLIKWQEWPLKDIQPFYLVKSEKNQDKYNQMLGSLLKRSLSQGEPISVEDVVKKGERSFLSALVRPGMRAVSLPLGNNAGVLISPGDWVDIISANMHTKGSGPDNFSGRTLVANIQVLAVDHYMDENNPKGITSSPRSITLEVTPEQAEILSMAMKLGNLTFSVRGLQKDKEFFHPLINLNDLKNQLKSQFNGKEKEEPSPKPSVESSVTIVRGVKIEKVQFPLPTPLHQKK
jgi:pilus assembly protein CpaB